jgi:hypothetical protein
MAATSEPHRRTKVSTQIARLVGAIREGDEESVEKLIVSLSESRRLLAPLALIVGGFVMLFEGIKLLVTNWRLMVVQILPAMWIWAAMLDLKIHALHGKGFVGWYGPAALALSAAVIALTAASFYLNAVFAFAVATPGPPVLRPAFGRATRHRSVILGWGVLVGVPLALAAVIIPRWGLRWFALAMSIVIAVMMFCYVAIPSRLLGIKSGNSGFSRRDKLAATAVGGAIGSVICTPPYLMGRIGVLMLGSKTLFVPGVILLSIGVVLQAGATGSVKAIKVSAKLAAGRPADAEEDLAAESPSSAT